MACKTDRIDSWVLAVLPKRDLVPALWLPDPTVRREQARCRPHVVKHRSMLKNRATRSGRQSTARRRIPRTRFDQRRLGSRSGSSRTRTGDLLSDCAVSLSRRVMTRPANCPSIRTSPSPAWLRLHRPASSRGPRCPGLREAAPRLTRRHVRPRRGAGPGRLVRREPPGFCARRARTSTHCREPDVPPADWRFARELNRGTTS